MFTADEKNNTMGQKVAATVEENQIYNMTILLDADYLADPNTTYPIRIDPTVNLTYAEAGADALEDVVIQSNNTPLPQYTASVIGKSSKGISRLLVRFPGMDFSAMEGVTVTSAYLSIRDLLCEAESMTLTCYPFTGDAWTETTANWSMTQSWGAALDSKNISYDDGRQQTESHRYNFDISTLVQQWVDGTADEDLGIILRADESVEQSNENFYKTFGSYERSSNKTYFVMEYNENISLSREDVDVYVGDSLTLYASTFPSGQNVTWSSENPEIATVEHGTVTGISPGTTTITARIDEDSVATCEVTVLAKSITLNPTSVSIYVGHTISLTADTVPEETLVEWISYNTSVATVSNGVVTGISPGTTIIVAKVDDNTVAQCEVTVLVRGVFIDPTALTMYTGETATIVATTVPAGENVEWYSTNPDVVTVLDGVVTAVGAGTATIGAYVDFGAETICDVTVWNRIELDCDSIDVDEGSYVQLMAHTTQANIAVSWSTSNPSIATVDASGKVTGHKAGVVMITATCNGAEMPAECVVYVTIPDGVYRIQNVYTNYYLGVENAGITGLVNVQQQKRFLGDGLAEWLSQMWKICYLGDGKYSIRPMHKLDKALDVTETNVDIFTIGTNDSLDGVYHCTQWIIKWKSSGYVFENVSADNKALRVDVGTVAINVNVVVEEYTTSLIRFTWRLEKNIEPISGALLYDTSNQKIVTDPSSML